MNPSPLRRTLAAAALAGACAALAITCLHNRHMPQAPTPLTNQALAGTWSGIAALPTGVYGHRRNLKFPVRITFRPDGTLLSHSGGDTTADYAARGKSLTYSHERYRGKLLPQPMTQQASLAGDSLTLINPDKSTISLKRD